MSKLGGARRQLGDVTVSAWRGAVVTTEAVVTEAAYLLSSAGADGTLPIQFCLRGSALMNAWTHLRGERASELMRKYRDVPMDHADATLVALADELDTPNVFTLDLRGFRTYRWKTHRAFNSSTLTVRSGSPWSHRAVPSVE